jgi:winged helix-turn-helix
MNSPASVAQLTPVTPPKFDLSTGPGLCSADSTCLFQGSSSRCCGCNLSDGEHSLLDIAERSELPFHTVADAADALHRAELFKEAAA